MFELIARIVLASAGLASSGLRSGPAFDLAWKSVAFFCAYSVLLYLLEQKRMRNAGISGLAAGLDAAIISLLLHDAGQLERFGFLTLTPVIWAAARHEAKPVLMAPIAAASLVSIANFNSTAGASPILFAQAAAILLIGLIAPDGTKQIEIREVPAEPSVDPEANRELRIKLRDALVELDAASTKAERVALSSAIVNLTLRAGETTFDQLAHSLVEHTQASGIVIYALDETTNQLRVVGSEGALPTEVLMSTIEWPHGFGEAAIKSRIHSALRTMDSEGSACRAVALVRDSGRPIGAITLFHASPLVVDEALTRLEDAEQILGRLTKWLLARRDERSRLHLAELLYAVAASGHGAGDIETLAGRVGRDMFSALSVDHVAIVQIDGQNTRNLHISGADGTLSDVLDFGYGQGIPSWIASGATEVLVPDALTDTRLPEKEALKRRVGCFAMLPIRIGTRVVGCITLGTHRAGAIDEESLTAARVVAGELAQAWARMEHLESVEDAACITPAEFRKSIASQPHGSLVYLDLVKKESLVEKFGQPAIDKGLREASLRLKALLPAGGFVCRRNEGDYVAFLPETIEEEARRWANQAVAAASLIPVSTPDGRSRIPMNLRAKVATLSPQLDRKTSQLPA
ncbi:MAG: GAF domain-containing protein [Fimbriimonadaceae bacterium]|nr:GAF domain-containing protein [Fimbriimonadaceae bacterium]